jgi:serine protease
MYIRRGTQPTSATYHGRPYKSGNTEACIFTNPAADTWYIGFIYIQLANNKHSN